MIVALGDVFSQIPQRGLVEAAMRRAQAAALEQDGCLSYSFAAALTDPGHYTFVGRWRDRAALDAHYGSEAFREYQRELTPLLVRDSELHVYAVEEDLRLVDAPLIRTDQDD